MAVILKTIVKVEKVILGCFILLATGIIAYDVIARRLGVAPSWGEEIVRYMMIWITFLGSALCFRRGAHFGIDVIRRVPGEKFQKFVSLFVILTGAVFSGFLLYYGWKYTSFAYFSNQKTPALGWPIFLVYMSVPVGAFLSEIHLLEVFLNDVLGIYKIQE